MKVLVVGDGRSKIHELSLYQGFLNTDHTVSLFTWYHYINSTNFLTTRRIQSKLLFGPMIDKINNELIKKTIETKPDLLFIYRGNLIKAKTLQNIRKGCPNIKIMGYNNDDPFAPLHSKLTWRLFKGCIREYDLVYAYRPHNVDEYISRGAKRSKVLMPWYCSELHFPIEVTSEEYDRYKSDVVFIGHYEDDGRAELLATLLELGINVRIFGPDSKKYSGWLKASIQYPILSKILPTKVLWGREYNAAISASKIAICFLSKLNRDRYTRRCFEIPSVGGFLLSEYTPELSAILKPGADADYFRNKEEFVKKVEFYLEHSDLRKQIARSGYHTIMKQGHSEKDRVLEIIDDAALLSRGALPKTLPPHKLVERQTLS